MKYSILFSLTLCFVSSAYSAGLCADVLTGKYTKSDLYWRAEIEKGYQAGRKLWYRHDFFVSKASPVQQEAYRMATRFLSGENHAVLAHKHLGYELKADQFGTPVMLPPESLFRLLRNFQAWKEEVQLSREENIELAFIFIKKEQKKPPKNFEEYVIVKASDMDTPGNWPDPTLYKNTSDDSDTSQLPAPIFITLLSRGLMQMPAGDFLDHEMAHLTEIVSESGKGRDSFSAELKAYSRRQANERKRPNPKKLLREALLLEFFALPDRSKSKQIHDLSARHGVGPRASVDEARDVIANHFLHSSNETVVEKVKSFVKEVSPLIYRQGGGSRDNYNLYSDGHGSSHDSLLNENGIKTPAKTSKKKFSINLGRPDALVTYLWKDLDRMTYELENPSRIESTLFHMQHNWTPKMKVTVEEYRKMLITFLAARMARIIVALNTGLELELTPAQTLRDGLAKRFNTNSKLARYLDAYLPTNSPIREAFNLEKRSTDSSND